jgi:hypothetical protein
MTKRTDPLDRIDLCCYRALCFHLRPSLTPTDCLEVKNGGFYAFREDATICHPLESVLLSEDAGPGGWLADVAAVLGVSAAWIVGFCDGFAKAGECYTDPDYIQGYLAAEELVQRHPCLGKITKTQG